MADVKLKPCPFCGGEAIHRYGSNIAKYYVCCENPKCRVQPITDAHQSKAVVTREWNRRAEDG